MNKSILYEIALSFNLGDRNAEHAARRVFEGWEIPAEEIAETTEKKRRKLTWFTDSRELARGAHDLCDEMRLHGIEIALRSLRPDDWQSKWKEDLKPFVLTRRIRVVPLWFRDTVKPRRNDIVIDTTLAFGTGLHPTTAAVAGFIEQRAGDFESFCDLGTGTGILAVIAGRNGARRISVCDISSDAVATARRNFRLNRCGRITARTGDISVLPLAGKYDLVAANILVPVLLKNRSKIVALVRPGKYLAVSGIWKDDLRRFREHFEGTNLEAIAVKRVKGWGSILYRKTVEARRKKALLRRHKNV